MMNTMPAMINAPSDRPAVIAFQGICKRFGKAGVLQNVAFQVEPGTAVGLVGVNGAGKTTIIKCLLDFCNVDSGKIDIFGMPHSAASSRQRLAYLPERFIPPHYLSGREFLRFMQSVAGIAVQKTSAEQSALQFGLDKEALDRPVRLLSKGMTQKLGLAACMILSRELMVLDEPMSGLDPHARAQVKNVFRDLKKDGRTLFFTSHSLADIEEICDHMLVLHRGQIAFSGQPRQLSRMFGDVNLEQAFLRCIGSDG
jgi:ABC-2 type transport system ATP-binding protein